MAQTSLLNHFQIIGELSVSEYFQGPPFPAGAPSPPTLAWVVGLGLSLALWYGVPLRLTPFPHDS